MQRKASSRDIEGLPAALNPSAVDYSDERILGTLLNDLYDREEANKLRDHIPAYLKHLFLPYSGTPRPNPAYTRTPPSTYASNDRRYSSLSSNQSPSRNPRRDIPPVTRVSLTINRLSNLWAKDRPARSIANLYSPSSALVDRPSNDKRSLTSILPTATRPSGIGQSSHNRPTVFSPLASAPSIGLAKSTTLTPIKSATTPKRAGNTPGTRSSSGSYRGSSTPLTATDLYTRNLVTAKSTRRTPSKRTTRGDASARTDATVSIAASGTSLTTTEGDEEDEEDASPSRVRQFYTTRRAEADRRTAARTKENSNIAVKAIKSGRGSKRR